MKMPEIFVKVHQKLNALLGVAGLVFWSLLLFISSGLSQTGNGAYVADGLTTSGAQAGGWHGSANRSTYTTIAVCEGANSSCMVSEAIIYSPLNHYRSHDRDIQITGRPNEVSSDGGGADAVLSATAGNIDDNFENNELEGTFPTGDWEVIFSGDFSADSLDETGWTCNYSAQSLKKSGYARSYSKRKASAAEHWCFRQVAR